MTYINIKVLLGDVLVGKIQSITYAGVGPYNGHKLDVSRIMFDRLKMEGLFSHSYVHPAAQKLPLQIVIETDNVEVGRAPNAWLANDQEITKNFTSGDWIIVEGICIEAEAVSGVLANPLEPK